MNTERIYKVLLGPHVSEKSAAPVQKNIGNDLFDDWDDDLEAFE